MAESLNDIFAFLSPFLIYLFLFTQFLIILFANFIYYQFILFPHSFILYPSLHSLSDREIGRVRPLRASSCGTCPTPSAAILEPSPYLGRGRKAAQEGEEDCSYFHGFFSY